MNIHERKGCLALIYSLLKTVRARSAGSWRSFLITCISIHTLLETTANNESTTTEQTLKNGQHPLPSMTIVIYPLICLCTLIAYIANSMDPGAV